MKTRKKQFNKALSFMLLVVFVFCASSVSAAPLSYSKTKSFQKESKPGSDNESCVFEELDEDMDDDSINTPVVDLFHSVSFVINTSLFLQPEAVHDFSEQLHLHTPLFISNRILRI